MKVLNLSTNQKYTGFEEMDPRTLSPYILKSLAKHQIEGRRVTLQTLVDEIGVRRADLRDAVSALHLEGYLDVLRMRLTMSGFAVGAGLINVDLPTLRRSKVSIVAA